MAQTHTHPDLLSMDRALLRQFKLGDPSALTRVYREYLSDVLRFLKRGFAFNSGEKHYFFNGYKEPWHLENGVQEVFIKTFSENARLAYDGIRPFRNYLFRIARNTVIDDFRQTRGDTLDIREQSPENNGRPAVEEEGPLDPEKRLWDKELLETVREFRDTLDDALGPFFEARFTEGRSVEACAAVLGWSEYRVKREEKQVRKLFFNHLKARGYLEGYCLDRRHLRTATLTALLMSMGGVS